MKAPKLVGIIGILLVVLAGSIMILPGTASWYQNLAEPPSIKPEVGSTIWSSPADAVGAGLEGPAEPVLSRDDAARLLSNPEPSTPASIERGKKAFGIYCAPCHGSEGHGDGLVAKKALFAPPDLPSNLRRFTDGYLYATIRNGGLIMPPQGYRIPRAERWDLVNYLRSIQK